MKKICFFDRSSVHYRKEINILMDRELPCDFYFGDSRPGKIEYLDVSLLKNFKGYFHNFNWGPFCWQRGCMKLLRSDYTDIITSADTYCMSFWMFLLFSCFTKKNLWLWIHGAFGDEGLFKKWIIKTRIKRSKGVFLYGHYAKNILRGWGVDEKKLHVIYNSLAYDEQLVIRKKMQESGIYKEHFGNENHNIVFIGRLTKVKKLDQILRAVSILKKKGNRYNVTFIGDGTQKEELVQLTAELGLENQVWFYGPCYDELKISDFIYNADVCVSPGNVGLTAMHAMTFGTPVITHNNFCKQMPEFEAIVEGETGSFFVENNIESLATVIDTWVDSHHERDKIRNACYNVIDGKYNPHYQIEVMKKTIYT